MKKLLVIFTLLFLVGCGKNFDQDSYANVSDKKKR